MGDSLDLLLGPLAAPGYCQPDGTFITSLDDLRQWLRNLPFDRWRRNQVWLELVLMACDLCCWAQALLLDGELRVAEPKTLRYRLLHIAARVVRHARRVIVRVQRTWPWAAALARAFARLRVLPLRC